MPAGSRALGFVPLAHCMSQTSSHSQTLSQTPRKSDRHRCVPTRDVLLKILSECEWLAAQLPVFYPDGPRMCTSMRTLPFENGGFCFVRGLSCVLGWRLFASRGAESCSILFSEFGRSIAYSLLGDSVQPNSQPCWMMYIVQKMARGCCAGSVVPVMPSMCSIYKG